MQPAPYDDRAARSTRKPGKALGPLMLLLAAACVLPNTGCSLAGSLRSYLTYNDSQNDFVMGFRNSVWARQAWAEQGDCFEGQPQLGSFRAGFRAGYASVAAGGNGCPPAVPPRQYWTWKYQTPEGQAKIAAWFSGFPHGARAAEEDQAGEYQNIPVSYAIEHQYAAEFNSSGFIEQEGVGDGPGLNNLEPLPNPGFAPPVPFDASARYMPPRQLSAPHNLASETGSRSATIPAAFYQPVTSVPEPPQSAWPR
jgi:hypothetical protein